MRISEKREQALYGAIASTITDLRIAIQRDKKGCTPITVDSKLYDLETDIWDKVVKVLNIKEA